MIIVIDTNVLMAAILKNNIVRHLLFSKKIHFVLPEHAINEVGNHKKELAQKAGLTNKEIEQIMKVIMEKIEIVPVEKIKEKFEEAVNIMKDIHITDAPFIATALAIKNHGIWSFDNHLKKQNRVKIITTRDIIKINTEETYNDP